MAASVVSDSDLEEKSVQEKNSKGKEKKQADATENEDEEDEEEEEYEIEAILSHKKGKFEPGEMAYFVKWKGYDKSSDNTWVRESDAENAKELIDDYWSKKKGRKSENGSVARKGRKSVAADSPEPASGRKRSRKAPTDDEKPSAPKRQKQRNAEPASSAEPEDVDMDDEVAPKVKDATYMEKFAKLESWEDIVQNIDTVERTPTDDSNLTVYIRLTKKVGGERVKLPSTTCNKKFPQKMLKFYEGNLKWKETEVEEEDT
ncbi:hypothetical protein V5O48_013529 [Marasmius crinis-equi]|uniref:Chromo domain-containing protein n=1 Tax=Marasmius crinis-equi TaxID=585013 RepID=A0ABR3EZT7_9AGAR